MNNFFDFTHQYIKEIISIAIIVLGAIILQRIIRWLIDKSFEKDISNSEKTKLKFFKNASSLIIWTFAIAAVIYIIPKLRALAITMFAGAGIFMAILGFAAQQAFANIISGVFIVFSKPFRVGDYVKIGTLDYGIVEDITLRHTIIKTFENKRIVIPNSVLSTEILINDCINDPKICKFIEFGISYDSDIDKAIKIIQEVAINHPDSIDNRTEEEIKNGEPEVLVRVISFGDSSVNLRAYVWTSDYNHSFQLASDIKKKVKERFDKEGIEIPFPYRTIVYKKDLINENQQK
ncbi:MAG: mechanosensitive ion channel family protein [Vicingaceae bacterium]